MPIDYSKYPKTWKAIRANVLDRCGHCCQFCGVPNHSVVFRSAVNGFVWYEPEQACEIDAVGGDKICDNYVRIVLTTAHLDHDIRNNMPENLAALCQRCHLRLDRKQHADSRRRTLARKQGQQLLFVEGI